MSLTITIGGVGMTEITLWKNQEMRKFRRDIDRLFTRFWSDFGLPLFPGTIHEAPRIDVSETEDCLIINAELPGVDLEDVDISLKERILTISGEKREERVEERFHFHRVERRYGSFSRSVPLPCDVEADRIDATYNKGVLKIVMPKCKEKRQVVKVEVK
jgi:HSP20 family protein